MNNDWRKLKQSADGLPTYDSLIPYVLEVSKNGEEATIKVIRSRVFSFLSIPDKLLEIKYPNYPEADGVLANRISFALSALYLSGALARPKRGIYQITKTGRKLLEKHGDKLTNKILKKEPKFIEYKEELALRNQRSNASVVEEEEVITNQEFMNDKADIIINDANNKVAIELLSKLRNINPKFFEVLVMDLLTAMGYSGENGKVEVTSQSHDGGIDGIINQDPLGTSTVYVQAKRYAEGNTVQRGEIQKFYGALAAVKADRGVFITTSRFSKGAIEFSKSQGIVLIDGIELTDFMLKYNVGVEVAKKYTVYRIDNDYFEFEE